jgi:pyrimidine operon attenuation protein / uracil phosphoribosyltransferase
MASQCQKQAKGCRSDCQTITLCIFGGMRKKLILDSLPFDLTLNRLCQQIIENHQNFSEAVLIGLQPRGVFLATLLHRKLENKLKKNIPLGMLDVTFHRDDFRRREIPAKASETRIDFIIEEKNVVLIDDVLFTGRTVRSALDALISFGRPKRVELLVLIDRKHTRDLPIAADYVGKYVDTMASQKVVVELEAQGHKQNKIWLSYNK